jgi:hypothetical protein
MSDELSWAEIRRRVAAQARGCCEYCFSQSKYASDPFSVEHIVPSYRGGSDLLDNLAFSCQGCNGHKATRTTGLDPETNKEVPLFHPRQHRWSEHFCWSADSAILRGLTPTGRATIETLQLNREGVVNLRLVLVLLGKHPPQNQEPTAKHATLNEGGKNGKQS